MAFTSSLVSSSNTAISRELGSDYDNVKTVAKNIDEVKKVASEDIQGLVNSINEAKDFTGITVEVGDNPNWDPDTKVLTVPTVKGDAGEKGDNGDAGVDGINGKDGIDGVNGIDGKTPIIEFSYNSDTGDLEYEVTDYE